MREANEIRLWAEVNEMAKVLDASEFGRICQCLLAISFQEIGYSVSHFQLVGRPDFVVEKGCEGYSVEAKAPIAERLAIKADDLMGIRGLGHKPVVTVLTYPQLATRWLVIDAPKLTPKAYRKTDLERLSSLSLEHLISGSFLNVLVKQRNAIESGSSTSASLKEMLVAS